jgi:hypothetical protein
MEPGREVNKHLKLIFFLALALTFIPPSLASHVAGAGLRGQEGAVGVCHVHRRHLSHDLRQDACDQRSLEARVAE